MPGLPGYRRGADIRMARGLDLIAIELNDQEVARPTIKRCGAHRSFRKSPTRVLVPTAYGARGHRLHGRLSANGLPDEVWGGRRGCRRSHRSRFESTPVEVPIVIAVSEQRNTESSETPPAARQMLSGLGDHESDLLNHGR